MHKGRAQSGFTIVELLIVVVVIAILAAITVVAYNGIQNKAKTASYAASINGAAKQLEMSRVNSGIDTYPDPASYTIPVAGSTTFSYLLADTNTYCITATNNGVSYAAAKGAKTVAKGSCVVNLVRNPKGIGLAGNYINSGWFYPLGTATDVADVSWGGRSDWHRINWTGSGNGIKRLYIDLADLQDTVTYTASVLVANPGATSVTFTMDFCDQTLTTFTVAAGESRRISLTTSRPIYDSVYRFIDLESTTASPASGLLFTDAMLTRTSSLVSFGDGNTDGWSWTGAPGLSKSTGPAQ